MSLAEVRRGHRKASNATGGWLPLSEGAGSERLTPAVYGIKGSALLRAARIPLPLAPGFILPIGAALERASLEAVIDRLESELGPLGGFAPTALSLYLSVTVPAMLANRPASLLHLGLNWATLADPDHAVLAATSLQQLLAALSNRHLPTYEDYLEEEEIGEQFNPAQHGPAFRALLERHAGRRAPSAPRDQVWEAAQVLRAQAPEAGLLLTAMMPREAPLKSLRARLTSRDPESGAAGLIGLRLRSSNPQVKGLSANRDAILPQLNALHEDIDTQLADAAERLEQAFGDVLAFDVAVGPSRWALLNIDPAPRSASAVVALAADLVSWGVNSENEALLSLPIDEVESLLHPRLKAAELSADAQLGQGLPASPGAASGSLVFSRDEALERSKRGEAVILVRRETAPEDVRAMIHSAGILTMRGGLSSHAAVIARGLGKPAVTGLRGLMLDEDKQQLYAEGMRLKTGQMVSIDGSNGRVFLGRVATEPPQVSPAFRQLLTWAEASQRLEVRANAEGAGEARLALDMGATGVGLCRTEHMLFASGRLTGLRKIILAETEAQRQDALAALLPTQRDDLVALFEIMGTKPVTVRLLDPPLHEFLPTQKAEVTRFAQASGLSPATIRARTEALSEANPMLGHRGCRLGISFPEIYEMQVRAILEAAQQVSVTLGQPTRPEIMIPLVSMVGEVRHLRSQIEAVARDIGSAGNPPDIKIGTMIETPRACIQAEAIAEYSDFFSFGTNDLTQTVYAISRDDAGKFLRSYAQETLLPDDPFSTLDRQGVGRLISETIARARAVKPDLIIGVCGEHGGDPRSIQAFEEMGVDYVSCAPLRVPVARLAAAQARLQAGLKVAENTP